MKKLLLMLSMLLISLVSYGQDSKYKTPRINGVIYYGSTKKLGFEANLTTKTNLLIGGGLSMDLNRGGIGEDYSATMGPNAFREEIYDIRITDYISIYGTIGYTYKRLSFGGKLGIGGKAKYYNAYDNRQILSPNGYYYTSTYLGNEILLGVFAAYKTNGKISPYFGYDTFNGINIGLLF
jgi:hypothetical protein